MKAMPDEGPVSVATSIKECFVILLSPWLSEDSRSFSKKADLKRNKLSRIRFACNHYSSFWGMAIT